MVAINAIGRRRAFLAIPCVALCVAALTAGTFAAEVITPSWLDSEEISAALASSTVMVKGRFSTIPDEEPADGVGVPGELLRMRLVVTSSYKGNVSSGDELSVYVPNELVEFRDSSLSRADYFFIRQEKSNAAKMRLVEKYNFYEKEFIEGRLSASEMAAIEEQFTTAYRNVMDGSTTTSITRQPALHGQAARPTPEVLIEDGQEYIVALVERAGSEESGYGTLSRNQGVYSGVDLVLVEKLLAELQP